MLTPDEISYQHTVRRYAACVRCGGLAEWHKVLDEFLHVGDDIDAHEVVPSRTVDVWKDASGNQYGGIALAELMEEQARR